MPTTTQLRELIDRCFAAHSVAGLVEVLGLAGEPMPVDISEGVCCVQHGRRGQLAAIVVTAPQFNLAEVTATARALRASNYTQLQLYIFCDEAFAEIVVASFGLGEHLLMLKLQRDHVRGADIEALAEMIPHDGEQGIALAARHGRALDRGRVTRRFFCDFAAQRDLVANAWTGIPEGRRQDREQLSLLLLSRLMFLYFLQHRDYLGGDRNYLVRRMREWTASPGKRTFYHAALKPLFFAVLNRRPEQRPARARAFGELPYLNGGLFERHITERRHPRIDLPDACVIGVFENLLERYRFTARETSENEIASVQDIGIDPEMLGRVFEGLMSEKNRSATGTFYTPAPTVDRLVRASLTALLAPRIGAANARSLIDDDDARLLDAEQRKFTAGLLREARVLDPACGSGAFLLGSLARMSSAAAAVTDADTLAIRRELVAGNLFGVDLQNDAAQLCALRLWLALVPGEACEVQPLPNLDRQVRQGDSLVDPIDLRSTAVPTSVRSAIRAIAPAAAAYAHAEPVARPHLLRAITRTERTLARAWLTGLHTSLKHELADLSARSEERDLFGDITTAARVARAELTRVRERASDVRRLLRTVRLRGDLPFFSYGVHFPEPTLNGFHLIVCNPPWVRAHNWSQAISALVQRRFEVCRARPWRAPYDASPPAGAHQTDLALLFLERALDLLAPDGILGIILPAKFMRSLSAASARRMLLERTELVSIEDHSLDQRSIFQADAFAAVVVARKRPNVIGSNIIDLTAVRRKQNPTTYQARQSDLPLITGDSGAPWLIVPPELRRVLGHMLRGRMIGAIPELNVRRGIVTGCNDALILQDVEPKMSGLAVIRAEGYTKARTPSDFEAVVEQQCIAPLVRGCDIRPWKVDLQRSLLCRSVPGDASRAARYVARHDVTMPRLSLIDSAVAWHDLARNFNAVVIRSNTVALNTVYYISVPPPTAHLLCAYFNSLPMRVFARAIAERAKDAHFRFFAWTVSLLPLPLEWMAFESKRLRDISEAAHADAMTPALNAELDAIVGRAFGLSRPEMRTLAEFDDWLGGA